MDDQKPKRPETNPGSKEELTRTNQNQRKPPESALRVVTSDLSMKEGPRGSLQKYPSRSFRQRPDSKQRKSKVEFVELPDDRKKGQANGPKNVSQLKSKKAEARKLLLELAKKNDMSAVREAERRPSYRPGIREYGHQSDPRVTDTDRQKYDERSKEAAVIPYKKQARKSVPPAKVKTNDVSEAEEKPVSKIRDSLTMLQNNHTRHSESKTSLKKVDSSDVPEIKRSSQEEIKPEIKRSSQEEIKTDAQSHSEEIKSTDGQEVVRDVPEVQAIAQDENKEVKSKESAEDAKPSDSIDCLKIPEITDAPEEQEEESSQLLENSKSTEDDWTLNCIEIMSLYENWNYIQNTQSEKKASFEGIKDCEEVKKSTQNECDPEFFDGQTGLFERYDLSNQDVAENMMYCERNEMDDSQILEEEEQSSGIIYEPKVIPKSCQFPFKLKQGDNGNILTVHHTVQERDKMIRIRMAACCFNKRGSKFVTVDKRGNIFIFDLVTKKYWRLWDQVPKATVIRQSFRLNEYLIGTKTGHLILIDIVQQSISKTLGICAGCIEDISFPGQALQPSTLALVHAGTQTIIVNLDTFKTTHRLDFDGIFYSLKFACYVPNSEQIFTCFTNDALHIWSGVTLNKLRVVHPIKMRDRKLKLMSQQSIPEISFATQEQEYSLDAFQFNGLDQDFSNGLILAYGYSRDGGILCLSTVDRNLLLLDAHTYDMQSCIKLKDFIVTSCQFLPKPGETLLLVVTSVGHVLLLDCQHTEFKLIVHSAHASKLSISCDAKLLAVLVDSGEAYIWATGKLYNLLRSHKHCYQLMRTAFKEKKPLALSCAENTAADVDLKKLLKPDRLMAILMEFGCYPAKYRGLIWSSLLQLPCNSREFQTLVKMSIPCIIKQRAVNLKVKQDAHLRLLIKIWSCLAHWCKVFAYSEFLPTLIFPFIHVYPKNSIIIFEVCATLLLNHFQLWFEYHPLEPTNYLNMCSNVLQSYDKQLYSFYASMRVTAKVYAWSLLANAFSVVFDAEQWLCLWDHIISYPIYFPIFCTIAYNVQQREVVMRLPNADAVKQFFYEQNAVDVQKVIKKAYCMMLNCPASVHPQRYIGNFTPIPKGVYVKFLNFPKKWVTQHEQELEVIQQEKYAIDSRIRELEIEEHKMMERLENGLKAEEHTNRIKEMEALYQNTLKREEQRMANQRQMLLLYQKEIRNRKGEALNALQESERRKKSIEMERELDALTHDIHRQCERNNSHLMTAEEELRNHNLELVALKCATNYEPTLPLSQKYRQEIENVGRERKLLRDNFNEVHQLRNNTACSAPVDNLEIIEKNIDAIYEEFINLTRTK